MRLWVYALSAFLTITALYWYLKWRRFKKLLDRLPSFKRTYWLIGNIHQLDMDSEALLNQMMGTVWAFQNPHLMVFWMACFPVVMVHGAEEAEAVLTGIHNINKGMLYQFFYPWQGLSLLLNHGKRWRQRRKLLTPAFHQQILNNFAPVFVHQAQILVRSLARHSQNTPSLDIYPFMASCGLDIICETAMGQTVHAQRNRACDYTKALHKLHHIVYWRQKRPWFWFDATFNMFGRGKEQDWCLKILHEFTDSVIEKRSQIRKQTKESTWTDDKTDENGNKRRLAFLDILLDLVDQGSLPMADVRNEVNSFLAAGFDTTSTSMSWCLYMLGLHPDIQSKVQAEVDTVFSDVSNGEAPAEYVKRFSYLECCIKEALRLYPSLPMVSRSITEDFKIGGYTVPAGAEVLINQYAVHRDPKRWPDPEIYDPDRFLADNCVNRHPFAFLPFSAGYRNCIGTV